jgi:type VI secretion system secreted protein VgrG
MITLRLQLESNEALDVRSFSVHEAISTPFAATIVAVSPDEDIDLDAVIGRPATFFLEPPGRRARLWEGVVSFMEQVQAEQPEPGAPVISTYVLRLVPRLWLTTLRRQNRIFQHLDVPSIARRVLGEHGITFEARLVEPHPEQEYRVQYGESDFAFISRLLEEEGIAYWFEQGASDGDGKPTSRLVLGDAPQAAPRGEPLRFVENPTKIPGVEYISRLALSHEVRPGRHTIRDYDFLKPDYELFGNADHSAAEQLYEQYHYEHGAFTHDKDGDRRATVALQSTRRPRRNVRYSTSCLDLGPGMVFGIAGHPRKDVTTDTPLLALSATLEGTSQDDWRLSGEAAFADYPHRPERKTPLPRMSGVQSALVVGPVGQEIHTDELGRIKVQFHWDREGKRDDQSSCWVRVSQGWGGAGYGMMALPRVGQEVVVTFWEGNPDQPLVVGRVYNMKNQVPFKLPEEKTRSTWRSQSSPASGGFNEITLEDKKGEELVYLHAEKDLKQIIKHDRHVQVAEVDRTLVGTQHLVGMMPSGKKGKMSTYMEMFDQRAKLTSGMAMVLLDGDSVTITGLTVNILGFAEVNIAGGKIKLNC